MDYTFTHGNVEESLSIMREAANWLMDIGKPLWALDELTTQNMRSAPDEHIVMYDSDGNSAATVMLNFEDRFFWPDVAAGTSGFIHKLSVRRKYAGMGITKHLLGYAASVCREKGISNLRLDCDAERQELCAFYESAGFTLLERKLINTRRLGTIHVALFLMELNND